AFTDAFFEAEIAKSISRAIVPPEALKIGPVTDSDITSNAFPPVKRALELLVMFNQSMPKERCQRNSPVVFKIIKESIASLQRAEGRLKSTTKPGASGGGTDPDLFMMKNLLILKNELLTLEIGDVSHQAAAASSALAGGNMQHFSQIWDTLRPSQSLLGGLLSSFRTLSTYIAGSSLWSRSGASTPAGTPALGSGATPRIGGGGPADDASEQLDGLLRQSIVGFTRRWAGVLNEARGVGGSNKLGGRNVGKVERELEEMLERAFSGQPEVVGKLKEAIQIEAQAQAQAVGEKRSYVTRV
ncbi:hypothetical protein C8A01DRAFT_42238, partial [Parachaetomium inaequale]